MHLGCLIGASYVLSDPDIDPPVAIAFDGNGRIFVLDERGFMVDADGTGELDAVGRISMHVGANGDGVADKKELFDTGYGRTGNVQLQEAMTRASRSSAITTRVTNS